METRLRRRNVFNPDRIRMFRRRQFWIMALFLVALVGTGGGIYYEQQRFRHFAVHDPGMVYRSAWLSPGALSQLIENYQIRSVVNLCNPDEMTPQMWESERKAVVGAGARLHTVPLSESIEITPQNWDAHFRILSDPNNYPMLVHCQHGVTRTGMFVTAYDVMMRHMNAEESVALQPTFGHGHANVHLRSFAKSLDKYAREHPEQLAADPLKVLR
jgi:protein tyrosine phosphatase (PTP) superfamily phosphohydrolase (DUF442 family)